MTTKNICIWGPKKKKVKAKNITTIKSPVPIMNRTVLCTYLNIIFEKSILSNCLVEYSFNL